MNPKLVQRSSFIVSGNQVRTKNSEEMNPETSKIAGLWQRFGAECSSENPPTCSIDSRVYGVYFDYETDQDGFYSVMAGVGVSATESEEKETVEIETGDYLVFEAEGPMPNVVIETWGKVWEYFQSNSDYQRRYSTDFEEYLSPEKIAIHIAVS